MVLEQRTMLELIPDVTNMTVLDLACGSGRYSRLLRAQGAAWVIGVDNSDAMLRRALRYETADHVLLGDVDRVPTQGNQFDLVICALALGHLPSPDAPFEEMQRVLKPGATALVSDLHPSLFSAGARRTFRARNGRVYAVEHYPHTHQVYERAAYRTGLRIDQIEQRSYRNRPVVVVYRLKKR